MAPVLERLSTMLEKSEALKAKLRSAMTYPLTVLILTGASLLILLLNVVPSFKPIFENAGAELPWSTAMILAASDALTEWGWAGLLVLLAVLLIIRRVQMSTTGARRLDALLVSTPVVGGLIGKVETARFCRSLGTLRANGVALIESLGIAAGTLSNQHLAEAVRRMTPSVARGDGLAAPMRSSRVFPDLAVQLIEIGEENGRLDDMLLQAAEVFDEEVERDLQRALALLTPIVTVVLGVLIAGVIGSILSAILNSYNVAL